MISQIGNRCVRGILLLGFLAGLVASCDCLAEPSKFVIRTWLTESGLPQNAVNAVVQTRDSYLWVGTENGLCRFDGVRFTVYGLREGLKSLQIKKLLEDRDGRLWIATRGGGLSRLENGQIRTYLVADGLAGESVNALAEDAEGSLWVATSGGLNRFRNGRFEKFGVPEGLNDEMVRALFTDRKKGLWVTTSNGVFQWQDGRFVEIPIPFLSGHPRTFYCMLEDSQGRLWGSIGDGMMFCRYHGKWTIYGMSKGLPYAFITSLTEGVDGTVWAGSLDEGLYYFDEGQFTAVKKSDGLADDAVRSLLVDREGNLWVGTRTGGLNRLTRKSLATVGAVQGLAHEYVRSLAETPEGRLWVCTTGGGLYSGKDGKFAPVSGGDSRMQFYPSTESVLVTRDDAVWVGAWGSLMRLKDGQLTDLYSQARWPWLKEEAIMALCEDMTNGVWMGVSKTGLKLFRDGIITSFGPRVSVTSILQAPDGVVWFGCVDGGLYCLKQGAVISLTNEPGLLSEKIRSLYMDGEGTLWIGTTGGGLSRFKDGRMTSFTTREGLVDDTISQILEDNTGNLWLGCNHGLERISKADLNDVAAGRSTFIRPLVFAKPEGMLAEECSSGAQPSAFKTKSGLLCFATVRGIAVVDPVHIPVNQAPPLARIEDVYLDGQPVPGTEWRTLEGAGRAARSVLRMPAGGARLEIHYTAFSYGAPEEVRFKYKIEGLDANWVNAGRQRSINVSHLPHGNYVFHIIACNNNGVWDEEGDKLAILIPPRFWEAWWFAGLSVIGAGLAVSGGARYLVRRKYQRKVERLEHLHAMESERSRIAQDLHDDLGNSLTEISLLSTLARSSEGEAGTYLAEITDKSRQLVKALDEIVWAVNPKHDHLSDLVHYLCLFAQEFLQLTTIRCRLDVPRELPKHPLDAERRHSLFLAVKEALNNTAKHSQATEVWLRFDVQNSTLMLVLEDNGRGFDASQPSPGRNGLENMRRRLESLGGKCAIDSTVGRGTRVCFQLPFEH